MRPVLVLAFTAALALVSAGALFAFSVVPGPVAAGSPPQVATPPLADPAPLAAAAEPASTPLEASPGLGDEVIQIALLLDTSNSMDGLIDQARGRLWTVVETFNKVQKDGKRPSLELALVEYGNDTIQPELGHIRLVTDFTRDLDRVSELLFGLQTNGGTEPASEAVRRSIDTLSWTRGGSGNRLIFVAGNEDFEQGGASALEALRPRKHDIDVHTIFCGELEAGKAMGWGTNERTGVGRLFAIDANRVDINIDAPQDGKLLELNAALNQTYLPFGTQGSAGAQRQVANDNAFFGRLSRNAQSARVASKSTAYYDNSHWDLVDAHEQGKLNWATVDAATLPAQLKGQSDAERQAYVVAMAKRRAEIKAEIGRVAAARGRWLEAEKRRRGLAGAQTLDSALAEVALQTAKRLGYTLSV